MKLRILLADDHEIVRRGLRALLEKHEGWEVCGEASDGREAVEKALELKPDVVIVDVGMPNLNGLDTTRQVLQHDPRFKVIVLTITDSDKVIREALDLTAREREITQLLAEGNSSKEVASLLNLSTKTVETHRSNIMRKLSFHSIRDLVVYAIKNNLIQIELPPPPKTPAGPTAA